VRTLLIEVIDGDRVVRDAHNRGEVAGRHIALVNEHDGVMKPTRAE